MAIVVSTNNSTVALNKLPSRTSFQGLMRGESPITLGKGLKAAYLYVDFNGTTYAAGGLTASALTNLPGWTAVLGAVPAMFTDGSTEKVVWYDSVADTFFVNVAATGAEHAAAACSGVAKVLFLGY